MMWCFKNTALVAFMLTNSTVTAIASMTQINMCVKYILAVTRGYGGSFGLPSLGRARSGFRQAAPARLCLRSRRPNRLNLVFGVEGWGRVPCLRFTAR